MNSIESFYIAQIRKIPLLTKKEERKLVYQVLDGNLEARKKLVESNLRLVVSIAKKYVGNGMEFIDLIDEGNLALQYAIDHYDIRKGASFSNYAMECINGIIKKALVEKSYNIKVSQYEVSMQYKINNIIDDLAVKLSRNPTIGEIAKECNCSKRVVWNIMLIPSRKTVSLNQMIDEDQDDIELGDAISSSFDVMDYVIERELSKKISDLLSSNLLTEKERKVLIFRYIKKIQPSVIADIFKTSRQYINKLEKSALNKLRNIINVDEMSEYLDNPSAGIQYIKSKR